MSQERTTLPLVGAANDPVWAPVLVQGWRRSPIQRIFTRSWWLPPPS
jgi:hypothetical protein